MTDQETIVALLDARGIGHSEPTERHAFENVRFAGFPAQFVEIDCVDGDHANVIGYSGFVATFYFSLEGDWIAMGAWGMSEQRVRMRYYDADGVLLAEDWGYITSTVRANRASMKRDGEPVSVTIDVGDGEGVPVPFESPGKLRRGMTITAEFDDLTINWFGPREGVLDE